MWQTCNFHLPSRCMSDYLDKRVSVCSVISELHRNITALRFIHTNPSRFLAVATYLEFSLNSCEARREGMRALFHENRMHPVYKALGMKFVSTPIHMYQPIK